MALTNYTPNQISESQNNCRLLIDDLITQDEYIQRMQALGIADNDIIAEMYPCIEKRNAARQAKQELTQQFNAPVQQPTGDVTTSAPSIPVETTITEVGDYEQITPPDLPPIDITTPTPEIVEVAVIPPTAQTIQTTCPELEHCRVVNSAVEELLTQISTAMIQQLTTLLNQTVQPIAQIQDRMIGQLINQLDKCEEKIGKVAQKALKPIREGIGQCWGYLSQCGCCYPQNEAIVYALNTGNYMESVGLPTSFTINITTPEVTINEQETTQVPVQFQGTLQTTMVQPSPPIQQPSGIIKTEEKETTTVKTTTTTKEEPTEVKVEQFFPLFTTSIIGAGQPIPQMPGPPPSMEPPKIPLNLDWFQQLPWENPLICREKNRLIGESTAGDLTGFVRGPGGEMYSPKWFLNAFGWTKKGDHESWGVVKNWTFHILWNMFHSGSDIIDTIFNFMKRVTNCPDLSLRAIIMRAIVGVINFFTKDAFAGLFKGFEYELNQSCPQSIPSQDEVRRLYVNGQITDAEFECWTRANNNLISPQDKLVHTERTKITYQDALKLHRLDRMDGKTYAKWAAENGVIRAADRIALEAAAIDIPTVSDLVKMMVRDVADNEIVDKYNLDDQFDKKWRGNLAKFGDAQGIDPEIAKLHWRAHWQLPSATQAFEMFHRLRPDSEFAQSLDAQSKAEAATRGEQSPGIFTTFDDLKQLLSANDLAWFWRERLAAIAFRPINRTDLMREFKLGTIGVEKVISSFRDLGYAPIDAKRQADALVAQVKEQQKRKPYPRGTNEYIKNYTEGLWTIDQLEDGLNFLKIGAEVQKEIVKLARDKRKLVVMRANVACIKNNYLNGAIDDVQAKEALAKQGMDVALAIENVEFWWCKKKDKSREITAAQLCDWRERRLITAEQQLRRLVNLGYKTDDAELIVRNCETDINEKAMKKVLGELKKQQAANEKAEKEARRREQAAFRQASKK